MLSESEKHQVMRWIWKQMHRSNLKLPPDQLLFEGEHDLAYLYNCGFVDTDRYSYDKWLSAFRPHRQKDDSYRLTMDDWLAKTPYRYFGPIATPFDPMSMREGEWSLDEYKKFFKERILPETTLTYEVFLQGLEQAKRSGAIKSDTFVINRAEKEKLVALMDQYAAPKRRRALDVHMMGQQDELEGPMAGMAQGKQTVTPSATQTKKAQKSDYEAGPQQSKQTSGKLTDLLSGSKKK